MITAGGANNEILFAVGQWPAGGDRWRKAPAAFARFCWGMTPDKLVRDLQDQFPNARLVGADRRLNS